jgi:hypothetical protein
VATLGVCLEKCGCPYPFSVWPSPIPALKLAYGESQPDNEPNGKTVVLFHGKTFGGYHFQK